MSVAQLIVQRLEPTIALTVSTITFAVLIGIPLGVLAAWEGWLAGGPDRHGARGHRLLAAGLRARLHPRLHLALTLDLLPVQGYASIRDGIVPFLCGIILPPLSLGMSMWRSSPG